MRIATPLCAARQLFVKVLKLEGVWHEQASETCIFPVVNICLQVTVGIVLLPVHFVPVLGQIVYLGVTGALVCWEYHEWYFEMLGMRASAQRNYVFSHFGEYIQIGLGMQLLQLIPVVGPFFFVSNVVGAALWWVRQQAPPLRPH
eukprot:SAG11_NODE_4963_length_1709_cov_0.933540_2_plen_145_part_00